MKKYIVVLLMLISAHALLANATTSQPGSIQIALSAGDNSPTMRVITQDEFDGKVPIEIHLNQSLIIPIHYKPAFLTNTPQLFFGPQNSAELSIDVDGFTPPDDSGAVRLNFVCTGTQVGQATFVFGEAGHVVKEFPIQVVE